MLMMLLWFAIHLGFSFSLLLTMTAIYNLTSLLQDRWRETWTPRSRTRSTSTVSDE